MKNPKEFYNDLSTLGKLFSWWIIPTYYITHSVLTVIGLLLYGILAVIAEIKGEY